ncbi:hypothetical protein [Oerskovia enterophila]|uniref:hypothetical protein n=1 Tax=Oerskovia enterophila TaxID=43678 RepID=UPI00339AD713
MAQQAQDERDDEHGRRAPRLAALVVVPMAAGLAAALLAARGARVVQSLPTSRVEVYLEILVLAVGAVLGAWIALTSVLALACVVAQSIGRRWGTGERLVLRRAPAAVRRLAGIGVSLSVGAGLALGAGSAQAVELPPAPEDSANGSFVVDLGWQPTVQTDGSVGGAGRVPAPAAEPSASLPSTAPTPSPGPRPSVSDGASPSVLDPSPGRDPSSVPAPVPTGAASWSAAPTSEPAAEPAPSTTAHPPASTTSAPTVMGPPPAAWPEVPAHSTPRSAHVPLGTLLGSPARAATPSPVTVPDPAAPAPSVVEIVVLCGDTLWSLAERRLGSEASDAQVAAECRRWFDVNRDVIGDDPDLIKPGQILSAPPSP